MAKYSERGFTLLEIVIVMALIGFLTLAVVAGSNVGIQNEHFSGELKNFADTIRQAQTRSYTVETGTATTACATAETGVAGGTACYWRGSVLNFTTSTTPGGTYGRELLYGGDLSQFSGNTTPTAQLTGETPDATLKLDTLILSQIEVGSTPTNALSLAFLAPTGEGYNCFNQPAAACTTTPNPGPFNDQSVVTFTLQDSATNLTGIVTVDPVSGTISTKVQ